MVWCGHQHLLGAKGRLTVSVVLFSAIILSCSGCGHVMTPSQSGTAASTAKDMAPAATPAEPNQPQISFERQLHDFGIVSPRSHNQCRFAFQNTGTAPLIIAKSIPTSCGCTVGSLNKTVYAPGEEGVIEVTYTAASNVGIATKHLTVTSNAPDSPTTLTIKARIARQVIAEPQAFILLPKKPNAGCPTLTLRSQDKTPFAITRCSSTNNALTIKFDPTVKKTEFTLTPTVIPEELKKHQRGILVLSLDHPKCPEVVFDYTVKSEYELKPSRVVLYNFEPNKPADRQVILTNNYGEPFTVDSASSDSHLVELIGQQKISTGPQEFSYLLKLRITPRLKSPDDRQFNDILHIKIKDGPSLELRCWGLRSLIRGPRVLHQ